MSGRDSGDANDVWIAYDGECPFCASYVARYRIQQVVRQLHMIDARSRDPFVDELRRARIDLDAGMVVKFKDRLYHGAEAMNVLALLGSDDTLFSQLNWMLFSRPRLARFLYPMLVKGRLMSLRLLGRPLIGAKVAGR